MVYDLAGALSLTVAFEPEFAFLDVGLPVMDRYELALQLRGVPGEQKPLKIYSLTGFGQPADHEKSAAAGLDGHLVKPVDASRVLAILSS